MLKQPFVDFGTDHMRRRSFLAKRMRELPRLSEFLIVDADTADARWLVSSLKLVCGHDARIRHARTLVTALEALEGPHPQVLFLDDGIAPGEAERGGIPLIRRAGYGGPIVALSAAASRHRSKKLIGDGAAAVLHKDDIESARVATLLIAIFAGPAPPS